MIVNQYKDTPKLPLYSLHLCRYLKLSRLLAFILCGVLDSNPQLPSLVLE